MQFSENEKNYYYGEKVATAIMELFDEPDFEDGAWCKQNELRKLEYLSGAEMVLQGETKLAFYFSEVPSVIYKIPIYSPETPPEKNILPIAETSNGYWDYCQVESEVYIEASRNNLQDFFASTIFLFAVDYVPVYISPFLPCIFSEKEKELQEKYGKYLNQYDDIAEALYYDYGYDINMTADAIKVFLFKYGKIKTESFLKFVIKINTNDFHNNNIGLDEDLSRLSIIDYSGYGEYYS